MRTPFAPTASYAPLESWLWVLGLAVSLNAPAQVGFERIRSFGFVPPLGASPNAGVIEGSDGWLYGTTMGSGMAGLGVVYRVAKDGGGFGTLHQFRGPMATARGLWRR